MGTLADLRQDVADMLEADAYFVDIPVLTEKKGDIANEIDRALGQLTTKGGKIGICAIVMSPLARVSKQNIPGPYMDPIAVIVHIEENVTVNTGADGTNKACSDVAERVLALHRDSPSDGRGRPLIAESIGSAEPVSGDLAYDVRFSYAAGVALVRTQVATPTASPDGGAQPQTVTLACATANAAIFYTIDGSRPASTSGTLYTAPVAIAAACTLKVQAVRPGYLTSAIKESVFT
jgi:hypothetical protein